MAAGKAKGALLEDEAAMGETGFPRQAAGGEEDGVDGDDVIVLGVEDHHAEQEKNGRLCRGSAHGRAAEQIDEAGNPDER